MAIKTTNITLDGLVHTLDDRDRVAAQLVNENANTFTEKNILSTSKNCSYINQETKGEVIGCLNNGVLSLRKN